MKALRELLTADETDVTLDMAALDLASIEHPDLDPGPWLGELDRFAMRIAEHMDDLTDGYSFIREANRYLFQELNFHGNETFYYDPRNSCLNDVIAFRTGLPISLSLVYMEVARRLEKPVYGIGAPGHFLVQFDDGRLNVYVDPFNRGRVLSREQCLEMVGEYVGSPAEHLLARTTPKQMIIRMLRNLEGAYVRLNSFNKALAVSDLLQAAGLETGHSLPRWPSSTN